MMILGVFSHPGFLGGIISYMIAQTAKGVGDAIRGEKIGWDLIYKTGGMPSSHSAFVTSIATGIYLLEGVSSTFVLALAFAIITMVDAFGLRQNVGHQAKLLNILAKELKATLTKKHKNVKLVRELAGHSGVQVVVGALLGIIVTMFVASF